MAAMSEQKEAAFRPSSCGECVLRLVIMKLRNERGINSIPSVKMVHTIEASRSNRRPHEKPRPTAKHARARKKRAESVLSIVTPQK